MATLVKIFLIISNFLLLCFKTVLLVISGMYLALSSLGGIGSVDAKDVYGLGALLLPPIVNLVMLLFLFNVLKSYLIKVIFLFINAITAMHYLGGLFRKVTLFMRLDSGSYLGNIDPGIDKMQVYYLGFFSLLFTFNTLVLAGFIKIHKKDKEAQAPTESAEAGAIAAVTDTQAASPKQTQQTL